MAFISLNSRNITKIEVQPNNISPIDITGLVTSVSGTYSSLSVPDSGISMMTGSIQLTQASQSFDFDDRFNEIWNRGIRLKITYQDPLTSTIYNYPVVGTSYITGSTYDFQSTLTLEIGCILSLLNFRTPRDLGVCVEIGSQVDVSFALIEILKAAGVYESLIDVDSFNNLLPAPKLIQPLTLQQGESILEVASKLAGQHGTFIYQTNSGIVRLSDWKRLDSKAILFSKPSRELHAFSRNANSESKVKRLILTYNEQSICSDPTTTVQEITQNDIRTTVTVTRNNTNRTVTRTTQEFRTFEGTESLISTSTEVSTYEPETTASATAVRIGNALPNSECYPNDPGRLLTKSTTVVTDNTNILSSWASVKATAIEATNFNVSGVITSKLTEEVWSYPSDNVYSRQITIFRPKGYVVPIIGDRAYRRTGDPGFADDIDPTELVIEEQISEYWEKTDDACVNWRYTRQKFINQYADQPEIVAERAKDTGVTLQTIADEAFLLVPVEQEILNNASEPSVDTFPPKDAIGTSEREIILGTDNGTGEGVTFGSNYGLDVLETKFLGDFFNFPESEIQLIGQQYMDMRNNRKLAISMADSPFATKFECWEDFVPLFRCKIIEPYKTDRAGIYIADTPTITITPEETVVGWLGIFQGFNTNLNNPTDVTFIKTVNQPTTDVDVFLPPSVNTSGQVVETLEVTV